MNCFNQLLFKNNLIHLLIFITVLNHVVVHLFLSRVFWAKKERIAHHDLNRQDHIPDGSMTKEQN